MRKTHGIQYPYDIENDKWEDILIDEDDMQAWESRFLDEAERATDEMFEMHEEQ